MFDRLCLSNEPIPSTLVQDDPSYAEIVEEFVKGLAGRLEMLETALRDKDFAQLTAAAHQLKGAGGGYGYSVLTEKAAQLESLAKALAIDDCASALEELKQLCRRVVVGGSG